MIRGIDHLVIACSDPDAAASVLEAEVGLASTGGGRHAGHGTFNRIAWLSDGSYLELIGVDDPALAAGNPVGAATIRQLDEHGDGLATYALRVDDLPPARSRLKAGGASIGPVIHGSRLRDDGELVEWWTAFPDEPLGPAAPPFLIEHAHIGAEWGQAALAQRARFAHPIGSPVKLRRLDLAAIEPEAAGSDLRDKLGVDVRVAGDLAVGAIGPHTVRFLPRREMPVAAVVTLGARVDAPRTAGLLGLRFDVERVEQPVPATAG